jgi:dihydroneopterin aldolase
MSSEIRLAFAHPSERSEATAGDDPLDRISLRDHIVEVEIGAFQAERGTTQRICFNVVVELKRFDGPVDDDVDRILSYDKVTEAIAYELGAERLNLLETLAERIAERILLEPLAVRVFVRIAKLDRGPGALGVEIVRSASGPVAPAVVDEERPHPRVVFLSNSALASENLAGWIDQLEDRNAPLVLCVGAGEIAAPQSKAALAQRRIDLLAIEQNAWVLAGRDARCGVVDTRTEMDWAMKNGQISVWAPSKIVLDAVDGPSSGPQEALALAVWFAGEMEACEMLVIGETPPENGDVPIRGITVTQAEL